MTFDVPPLPRLNIPFMKYLVLEHELVYYDRPICYLLKDTSGRTYLSHYLDTANQDEYWYLAPIDRNMIPRLLTGQIALLSALVSVPEESRLIGCLESRGHDFCRFKDFIQCPDVSSYSYFLPKPSFNFFKDEFEEYLAEELEPVTSYSRARLAEVIYLRLFGSSITPSLFPLSQLSEIGQSFQRLITNLALFNADPANFGKRGHGLHSVEHASQFALTGVFAGSVQLRIESIQPHDLLPELNPAYQGIKSFTELSQQQDVQQVCQLLGTYPPRLCSSFLAYITAIQKTNAGISLRWGSPQLSDEWHVRWTPERVSEVASEVSRLTISNESVFEATGFFIEGSMTSGRFTFLDTSTARRFRGVLAPEIEQSVVALSKESKIAVLYDVVVRETISTTPANAASCEYTFLEVREAGKKE